MYDLRFEAKIKNFLRHVDNVIQEFIEHEKLIADIRDYKIFMNEDGDIFLEGKFNGYNLRNPSYVDEKKVEILASLLGMYVIAAKNDECKKRVLQGYIQELKQACAFLSTLKKDFYDATMEETINQEHRIMLMPRYEKQRRLEILDGIKNSEKYLDQLEEEFVQELERSYDAEKTNVDGKTDTREIIDISLNLFLLPEILECVKDESGFGYFFSVLKEALEYPVLIKTYKKEINKAREILAERIKTMNLDILEDVYYGYKFPEVTTEIIREVERIIKE